MHGEAYVVDAGFEFERDRALLYEKFPQYESEAPIEEGIVGGRRGARRSRRELGSRRLSADPSPSALTPGPRAWPRAIRDLPATSCGPGLALADRVQDDQLGVEAGSLTYGAFLSLPPLLLLLISIIGIVFQQRAETAQQDLIEAAGDLIPGFDDVVSTQLELATASQIGTGLVGLMGIVYAASGFVARIRHALGAVFRTRRTGLVVGRSAVR